MLVGLVTIKLYAPFVHSLKEKRMIVKSICSRIRNKFNVSVIEASLQDTHQTVVIAVACVASTMSNVDSLIENVINFVEGNTEAEVIEILRETR